MKRIFNYITEYFNLDISISGHKMPKALYTDSDFYTYIPSLYTPSSISHYSIFKEVNIRHDLYVFLNLNSSTYRYGDPMFTPNFSRFKTYKYRLDPYNWPVTDSLDTLQIRKLLYYKNSITCRYQQNYDIRTILEEHFQTKSYDFLRYDRITKNYQPTYQFLYYKPYNNSTHFTFNLPTRKHNGRVNRYADSYHIRANPYIRTIEGQESFHLEKKLEQMSFDQRIYEIHQDKIIESRKSNMERFCENRRRAHPSEPISTYDERTKSFRPLEPGEFRNLVYRDPIRHRKPIRSVYHKNHQDHNFKNVDDAHRNTLKKGEISLNPTNKVRKDPREVLMERAKFERDFPQFFEDLRAVKRMKNTNKPTTSKLNTSENTLNYYNPTNKVRIGPNHINKSTTLELNTSKNTLNSSNPTNKVYGDTTELPFIPEFYNWFIFLFHYMLLFTFSLLFLFPPKNFKFINPNFNINHQVLWPKKYPQSITKVYKCWINYLFKRWRYR